MSYMDVSEIVEVAKKHEVDAVHPGYGFLSESAELDDKMTEIGVMVVGPGADILNRTGDKLQARRLAEECNVTVLPAFTQPTGEVEEVRKFASQDGLPIMIKAVDGGGGRGIRLVRNMDDLNSLVTRAIEESPSKQVFAEKAAIDGFRHVEVQIIGDGKGNVMHLWERECSIQRRYQKIVELAPSMAADRSTITPVIESAVAMAKKVRHVDSFTCQLIGLTFNRFDTTPWAHLSFYSIHKLQNTSSWKSIRDFKSSTPSPNPSAQLTLSNRSYDLHKVPHSKMQDLQICRKTQSAHQNPTQYSSASPQKIRRKTTPLVLAKYNRSDSHPATELESILISSPTLKQLSAQISTVLLRN